MLRGQVGFRLAGRVAIAEPGVELIAPPGTPHDWWNAESEEALVRIEMRPAARFEAMIRNAFGLAQDGKVNKRGIPNPCNLPSSPWSSLTLCSLPGHPGSHRRYYLAC